MSGSFVSTGVLTNKGKKIREELINVILNLKIEDISIQIIPLSQNKGVSFARIIGKTLQEFIHPAIFSPTLSHIAIQLTLEKDVIAIIEYGQYFSEDSQIENTNSFKSFSESSNSLNNPRTENNNLDYYYINKDGARVIIFDYALFECYEFINKYNGLEMLHNETKKQKIINYSLIIMACKYYGISYDEFTSIYKKLSALSQFHTVECSIKNKITLKELCNNFKGKNWEAKDYNVSNHNCQTFAAEVIKILKAERIKNHDKLRRNEKDILPNCIISALWDNENLSPINTIGRIPVVGYVFDMFAQFFVK